MSANHTALHTAGIAAIRKHPAIGRAPDLVVYLNSRTQFVNGSARAMPGLTTGATDLICILAPHGRLMAVECKTGDAETTDKQDMFIALVRKMGGFATVIRFQSEAEAVQLFLAALTRARLGMSE